MHLHVWLFWHHSPTSLKPHSKVADLHADSATSNIHAQMLDFAASAGIKPQCELMPLSQVNEAMARVKANKARYRIVLTTDI